MKWGRTSNEAIIFAMAHHTYDGITDCGCLHLPELVAVSLRRLRYGQSERVRFTISTGRRGGSDHRDPRRSDVRLSGAILARGLRYKDDFWPQRVVHYGSGDAVQRSDCYFISGKALEPLKELAQQAEKVDQDNLVDVRLEENTVAEFRQLSQSVNQMLDRLAHSFDLQRQFAGNAAHELKTPLMSISGYAEIIENNMVKPEDIPKFAGRIHSEASRLSSLVEDIIKLSRLDENDQSIPMEEVDLMQTCRDVEGHLSIRAKEQQVKMTLRGESCRIKGARQVLYEMIYNLCDNAIKYNRKDGEVEVTVSRGRNGRAVVSVADTGIGIAKEDQERIFERFYRVDKSHSRETGGTGLGLSIVKHGAILHDAKIKIESTLGTGTKIILEF